MKAEGHSNLDPFKKPSTLRKVVCRNTLLLFLTSISGIFIPAAQGQFVCVNFIAGEKDVVGCESYAEAFAAGAVALGAGASAEGEYATAIGSFAFAGGDNSTALGSAAAADADSSLALGNGAKATSIHSVALGEGAVTIEENTVSVGSDDIQRRIVNVAQGVNERDAVNLMQLNESLEQVNEAFNHKLIELMDYVDMAIKNMENSDGDNGGG